jgi:hypothetical protein
MEVIKKLFIVDPTVISLFKDILKVASAAFLTSKGASPVRIPWIMETLSFCGVLSTKSKSCTWVETLIAAGAMLFRVTLFEQALRQVQSKKQIIDNCLTLIKNRVYFFLKSRENFT